MTIDKATIVNWALTELGAGPIFSIDDGSDLSEQVEACWQRTVDYTFSLSDWSFSTLTKRNEQLSATPENGWRYGFSLPANRIGNPLKILRSAGSRPYPLAHRDFMIEGGALYANVDATWSVCKFETDPESWEPGFRAAFVIALAGNLAVPVWHDDNLKGDLLQQAFGSPSQQGTGGMFGRLIAQDKASQPMADSPAVEDPLSNARNQSNVSDNWYGRY